MKTLSDVDLSKLTTIKIGGIARTMKIPESTEELIDLIQKDKPEYYIGGGSNLLINERVFDLVVDLRSFAPDIISLGAGKFRVGASVRLQKLINSINEHNYGGIEFLYSVPGLVGGAVVMNAGRGEKEHKTISDYIISVDAIRDGKLISLNRDECGFAHRTSVFKNTTTIVTSVLFSFPEKSMEVSQKEKKARIEYCKLKQDNASPNFGSVFMTFNPFIMELSKRLRIGGKKAHFSGKTRNWILNSHNARFTDVINAIHKAEKLHKITGKKCRREVIVWE